MSDASLCGSLSEKLNLQSPAETANWLILKEGYLKKSKLAKGLIKSTKLRWFVLKQDPVNLEGRLEYYEGMLFRGNPHSALPSPRPFSIPPEFQAPAV